MTNKLRFLMPRLIGATLVVGIAAFIITTLFKLLLGMVLLGGAITLMAKQAGKRRKQWMAQFKHQSGPGYGGRGAFGNSNMWGQPIQPITGYATQKGTTIIPIN